MQLRNTKIPGFTLFFWFAAVLYFIIGAGLSLAGWKNYPDTVWIVQVAQQLPTLRPWSFFRTAVMAPPIGSSVNYPPLLFLVVYPFTLLGRWFGWSLETVSNLYSLPLFLSDIAVVYLALQEIRLWRPRLSMAVVNWLTVLLFFSGFFLYTSGFMGHPETLLALFSLLGIRFISLRSYVVGGIFFGLALATKQTAAFILLPVLILLYQSRVSVADIQRFCLGTGITFLVFILPFMVVYPKENFYDMFSVNQSLVIRGANFWWLLDAVTRRIFFVGRMIGVYTRVANPVLFLVTIGILFSLLSKVKLTLVRPSFFGMILVSLLVFSIFSKWLGFYHHLLPFVFAVLWETIRRNAFPVFAVTYAFLISVSTFTDFPFWQLAVLLINITGLIYVYQAILADPLARKP